MRKLFLLSFILLLLSSTVFSLDLNIDNFGFRSFNQSNQEYTPYLSVILYLNYTASSYCRFCNDNVSLGNNYCQDVSPSWSSWELCSNFKLWELEDFTGTNEREMKYVFAQADLDCDGVGCTPEERANDSIYYDYTGIGLDVTAPTIPSVVTDEGNYTNVNDSLFVSWTDAIDLESNYINVPLVYKVRALENGTPITSWFSVGEQTSVTLNLPFDMRLGYNYSVEVSAINSVGLYINSTSDGIFYDPYVPNGSINLSVLSDEWISETFISAVLSATDNLSGVLGFSYRIVSSASYIPDSVVDSYGSNANISFYLPSGIYYLHVVPIDISGNVGDVITKKIMIDNTPPTKPIFNSSMLYSVNQSISWVSSQDYGSGVQDYFLEIAINSDFSSVVNSFWIHSNLSYFDLSNSNVTGGYYYVRIKSKDNLNQESLFSDQENLLVDVMPPIMSLIRPVDGFVFSSRPSIAVSTDEDSVCYYKLESDTDYSVFSYTGYTYHEAFIDELVDELGSQTVFVKCLDLANNPSEKSYSLSLRADSDLSGIRIFPSENYLQTHLADSVIISQYQGGTLELLLDISPRVAGLSDLFDITVVPIDIDQDDFQLYLKKNDLSKDSESADFTSPVFSNIFNDEFGVGDFGDGTYSLKFKVPSFPGKYELYVSALGVDKKVYFQVLPLDFSLRYVDLDADIVNISSLSRMITFDFANSTLGIASESESEFYLFSKKKDSIFETELTDYDATLLSDVSSNMFFFLTKHSEYIDMKNTMLEDEEFSSVDCPSFGYPTTIASVINVIFTTEDIELSSSEFYVPGKYTLFFENVGVNGLKKVVSLSSLFDFAVNPDEVKYTRYDSYG